MITQLRMICGAVLVAGHAVAQNAPAAPEEDIRGPRGLIEIPSTPPADHRGWWIAAGVLTFLVIAYFVWKWWKKTHTPPTAQETAMQALQSLPLDCTDEAFANEVSSILRTYIQQRYSIAATQRSSEEFLAEISNNSTLGVHQSKLRDFLRLCDKAKFASATLSEELRHNLVDQATTFVVETSQPLATPA